MYSSREYTGRGEEYVGEVHDERTINIKEIREYGQICEKVYDAQPNQANRGLVTKRTSPNGLVTEYTYDLLRDDALTYVKSTFDDVVYDVTYGYDNKRRLSKITRGGFDYDFTYDGMSRMKSVKIAGTQYSENEYNTTGAETVVTTTYGNNGEKLTVRTDSFSNPVSKTYTDKLGTSHILATAEYDNLGKVTKYIDNETEKEYTYIYDEIGNVEKEYINGAIFKEYEYDSHGRLTNTVIHLYEDGVDNSFNYLAVYEKNSADKIYPDNTVVGTDLENVFTSSYTRDNLCRNATRTLTSLAGSISLTEDYIYNDVGKFTSFVDAVQYKINGVSKYKYSYEYDLSGNISRILNGNTLVARYTYDGMNQLIREDNYDDWATYTYTYDTAGNILSKKKYYFTLNEPQVLLNTYEYTYDTTNKDRLISLNGEVCTYDTLGNPTVYRNHNLIWDRVRLLTGYDTNTFAYNADGIRVRKNGTVYTLDGSNIIKETRADGTKITYYYDNTGVCGFRYNGRDYFYVKNLQGDITEIYDQAGFKYATYTYDAWGNHTINIDVTGIASLNPFRYRGYYFDTETGLYYNNSRYYDPQTGRFINTDSPDILTASPTELTDKNLYAYCDNNPVTRFDKNGQFWNTIIGAVAGAIVGGISAAISGTNIAAGVVSGALSGAVSGAAVDIAIATGGTGLVALAGVSIASGAGGAASSYVNQRMNGINHEDIDGTTILIDGIWGAVGGAFSFGVADVGGKMCRTLSQNMALSGKEFLNQVGSDFATTSTIAGGTWLNGTKMNLIKDGKARYTFGY